MPELAGTNKKALFLMVWSAFVGRLKNTGVYAQEVGGREGETGPAGPRGY